MDYTTDYQSAYWEAEAIFIGVGPPEQPDGSANLSDIATVARQIAENVERDCLVVVKSTVPVGTNDKVEQFIHAYDPVGVDNFKKRFPDGITYVSTPEKALKEANVCFIFTEWNIILLEDK